MLHDNEKLIIGEKIFNDINIIFNNDDNIDELGFIMDKVPSTICIEHKLGMSLGSLKPLFIYCSNKLNEIMKKGISSSSLDNNSNNDIIILLSQITRGLLLVRGDYPPAFVYRKQLIILGKIIIDDELRFLNMLFTQHPKSPSSWQHRRWCLLKKSNNNNNNNNNNSILSIKELDNELLLCSTSAESYPKNYYAWMHRLWLLQYMDYIYIEKELDFIDNWLLAHVSDHSAVNHKNQILIRLIKLKSNNEDIIRVLITTLIKNEKLLLLRPGNEALWYDRRGIMLLLLSKMKDIHIDNWNHIYTKRIPQYINDFNTNNEYIIENFDNIVLDKWEKDDNNQTNYYDIYHNTNTNNTKTTLETLGIAMSNNNNDNNKHTIENFILFWIHSEILFCRNCSLDGNKIL